MTRKPRTVRGTTACPTINSRIRNGDMVTITRGAIQGKHGKALIVAGSMWTVEVEGKRIGIHRTSLRRLQEVGVTV